MWPLVFLIGLYLGPAGPGTCALSSGFSRSLHALMCAGWGPLVFLGLVSSFRVFSKKKFLIFKPPTLFKIFGKKRFRYRGCSLLDYFTY